MELSNSLIAINPFGFSTRLSRRSRRKIARSVTSLQFEDAAFDCVWSANVFQYLTEHEAATAIVEMKATPRGRRGRSAAWRRDWMA